MKTLWLIGVLLLLGHRSVAQEKEDKPVIDSPVLNTWPTMLDINATRDGAFIAYRIVIPKNEQQELIIQNMTTNAKKHIIGKNITIYRFSGNGKYLLYAINDSLILHSLGTKESDRFMGVVSNVDFIGDKSNWCILTVKDEPRNKWLINISTNEQVVLSDIAEYQVVEEKELVLNEIVGHTRKLYLYALEGKTKKEMWQGEDHQQAGAVIYNKLKDQYAFTITDSAGKNLIYVYSKNANNTLKTISDESAGLPESRKVLSSAFFSVNGRWLFFKAADTLKPSAKSDQVRIWSYKDSIINPAQNGPVTKEYYIAYDLADNKIIQIESDTQSLEGEFIPGDEIIVVSGGLIRGPMNEVGEWWYHSPKQSYWLLSLTTGKRTLLSWRNNKVGYFRFSNTGKFIIYWNAERSAYYCYDMAKQVTNELTKNIPEKAVNDFTDYKDPGPVGIAGWLQNDSAVYIYGNYDIWKVNLWNAACTSLTNKYGLLNTTKLRFIYSNNRSVFKGAEKLLLTGFSKEKYNGFYEVTLNEPKAFKVLISSPHHYYTNDLQRYGDIFSFLSIRPLELGSGKKKRWIVIRESYNEYPNYYITGDFKTFRPITDFKPQSTVNWLTAELVTWKMYDGEMGQGILYKPENFDSTKKYPVIINYYERFAQRLYHFPKPSLTIDNINIPWFVSRGYLVFTPDIYFKIANTPGGRTAGQSAYNVVASVVDHFQKFTYIDTNRIGIQGHSFGGFLTNYLITHWHKYAAAVEFAGNSDYWSVYLTLVKGAYGGPVEKVNKQDHFQLRMGASLWERPDLYNEISPIIHADKINKPLLMVHNRLDASINFNQAIELYMALRRLGKVSWLLEYEKSAHSLNFKDAKDYTIRLTQYFDHYLKGYPAPDWMDGASK